MKNFKSLTITTFSFLISFSFLMSCGGDPEPVAPPTPTVKNTSIQKLEKRFPRCMGARKKVAPHAAWELFF